MAAQDISANLVHPAQANLAGALDALMIEKFDGRVHEHEQMSSVTDGLFTFIPLVGTDTLSNAAMGDPTLQAVVAGVEPLGKEIEVGSQIVQVKTPILARVVMAMLSQVQDRLSVKSRTPANFGKKIAKTKDQILLHQAVKSGMKATGAGEVTDIPGGVNKELASATDELDATKFEAGIMTLAQGLMEQEIELTDGLLFIAPAQYFTLLKNDKLTSADYSRGNADYSAAMVSVSSGMPIKPTNRLSQAADDGSVAGSNANMMGANYVVTDEEADVVGLYATPDSIMVAQSIPLTTDVYWEKRLLTWFIDSYLAFGAAPDRPDKTAVLRKYRA
jgi:hypothetical protein